MTFCPSVGCQYKNKETNQLRLGQKALYSPFWLEYLRFRRKQAIQELKIYQWYSSTNPPMTNTYQDHAVTLFNKLLLRDLRNTVNHGVFSRG